MLDEYRRRQILDHPAAWGRRGVAEFLADRTTLSVTEVIAALETAPSDPGADLLATVRSVVGPKVASTPSCEC